MRNLESILALLRMSRDRFVAVTNEVPEDFWRKSPGPGAWSPAEVVAHVTTAEQFIITLSKTVLLAPPKPVLNRFHLPVLLVAFRFRKRKTPIPMDSSLISDRPVAVSRLAAARENVLRRINIVSWTQAFVGLQPSVAAALRPAEAILRGLKD